MLKKALWLDKRSHVTIFNQSDCIISAKHNFTALKNYDIGFRHFKSTIFVDRFRRPSLSSTTFSSNLKIQKSSNLTDFDFFFVSPILTCRWIQIHFRLGSRHRRRRRSVRIFAIAPKIFFNLDRQALDGTINVKPFFPHRLLLGLFKQHFDSEFESPGLITLAQVKICLCSKTAGCFNIICIFNLLCWVRLKCLRLS